MPSRVYWIYEFSNSAKIGIMARPRGNEWLEEEIVSLKKQKTDILISLLEQEEASELGLSQEQLLCNKHDIRFYSFPIKDRALPDKNSKAENFIESIYAEVKNGLSVVVHCRMGIGRSTIIAAAVIQHAGNKTDDIISKITRARGLTVPDTEDQLKWLKSLEKNTGR